MGDGERTVKFSTVAFVVAIAFAIFAVLSLIAQGGTVTASHAYYWAMGAWWLAMSREPSHD